MNTNLPIGENDLHAWLDGGLAAERAREVEAYLAARPEEAARVAAWRAQTNDLRALFDPVQDEAVPPRLVRAAARPRRWWAERLAAGLAIALVGGAAGWTARGASDEAVDTAVVAAARTTRTETELPRRAAVAHAVFAPDLRRPVEVDAAHEEQLVAWLSKRMGSTMKAPSLGAVGYDLLGGRLLPGERGPVAQFMYGDAAGERLTLYVSREVPGQDTAFRFGRDGTLNVFYWIDNGFGYAISAGGDRATLLKVSQEVYRQLGPR